MCDEYPSNLNIFPTSRRKNTIEFFTRSYWTLEVIFQNGRGTVLIRQMAVSRRLKIQESKSFQGEEKIS